jgi:hypothetical protein
MRKVLQKIFLAIATLATLFTTTQTFAAEGGNNVLDALNWDNANWTTSITTTGPTTSSVTIEFPVFSANGEQIMNYAVSYVKDKSIASADITDIKKATFEGDAVKVVNGKINIVLQWLTADSTYNFVVSPINKEGVELDLSDEFSFKTLAAAAQNNTTPTNNPTASNEPLAGSADTASANFTYTLDNNRVTVKWNSIAGASKFSFSTKELTQSTYTFLSDVNISSETYSFVIGKVGSHTVKIVPVDAAGNVVGAERVLAIKIDNVSAPTGTGTPATWAGLNLILMSTFLMMLVYVVYRFRTTK